MIVIIQHRPSNDFRTISERLQTNNELNNRESNKENIFSDEDVAAFSKYQQWMVAHAPEVHKMKSSFTIEEFLKIKSKYPNKFVQKILIEMDDRPDLTKKHKSAYRMFLKWAANRIEWDKQKGLNSEGVQDAESKRIVDITYKYQE